MNGVCSGSAAGTVIGSTTVDAEPGVFMLLYLDLGYEQAKKEGRLRSLGELRSAILEGAVQRVRPKFMTVATMFLDLIPIMWSPGTGADVMKRTAAPLIGGIFTSFLLELLVYPAIYEIWKWHREVKMQLPVRPEEGSVVGMTFKREPRVGLES